MNSTTNKKALGPFSKNWANTLILDQTKFPSLNGLRAISILTVLYAHTYNAIYGALGVKIFFVISGFLITTLLLKEKTMNGSIDLRQFYIRRAFRILPVAFLVLFVMMGLNLYYHLKISYFFFAIAFLFLSNIIGGAGYIGHYWSLSVEEQFYLIFPFILKKSTKLYTAFLVFFLLFIEILNFFKLNPLVYPKSSVVHYIMYVLGASLNFTGIVVGSLSAIVLFTYTIPFKYLIKYKLLLHIFLVPVLLWLYAVKYGNTESLAKYAFNDLLEICIISFLLILNLIPSEDMIFKILNHPVMVHIGVLSYSIYMWQQMFTRDIPWKHTFKYSDSVVLNISMLFIMASLSYYFFEKKFLKIRNHFTRPAEIITVEIQETTSTYSEPVNS